MRACPVTRVPSVCTRRRSGRSWTAASSLERSPTRCAGCPEPSAGGGRRYGPPVRQYYEDLWGELPERLEPPDFERRRSFLLAEVRAGVRVLDVGCGEGTFTGEVVAAGGVAVGVDVAEAALARARARAPGAEFRRVEFDGELPFEDGSFEVAWASEVIEHVADTARWLSE